MFSFWQVLCSRRQLFASNYDAKHLCVQLPFCLQEFILGFRLFSLMSLFASVKLPRLTSKVSFRVSLFKLEHGGEGCLIRLNAPPLFGTNFWHKFLAPLLFIFLLSRFLLDSTLCNIKMCTKLTILSIVN